MPLDMLLGHADNDAALSVQEAATTASRGLRP